MTSVLPMLFFFVVFAVVSKSFGCPCSNNNYYLSLSNGPFYAAATRGNKINGCYITRGGSGAACDLYAKTPTRGRAINPGTGRGYNGWPRTPDGRGTGCVRAPNFKPRRVRTCYYRYSYNLPSSFVNSICTNDGVTNAVRQLKDAIRKGQCNQCKHKSCPSRTPVPRTPGPMQLQQFEEYFSKPGESGKTSI